MRKFRIVGAGFSGLSLAYYLKKTAPEAEIIIEEKNPYIGGLLQTEQTSYGPVEKAANAILDSYELQEMSQDIGLKLIYANTKIKRAYFLRNVLVGWPLRVFETLEFAWSFIVLLFSHSKTSIPSQTLLSDWVAAKLGASASRYLVDPAIGGIYASSADKLSAKLILGRFFTQGNKKKSKRKIRSVSTLKGMNEICQKLRSWLEKNGVVFRLNAEMTEVVDSDGAFVVFCGSLSSAQKILQKKFDHYEEFFKLQSIDVCKTTQFYDRSVPYEAFGILYPSCEKRPFLGTLLNSKIFPEMFSKHSETWIRNTVLSDREIINEIKNERASLLGARDIPLKSVHTTWEKTLPLYGLELETFLSDVWPLMREELKSARVFLHGNYLGKLGLSQILLSSKDLAYELAGA